MHLTVASCSSLRSSPGPIAPVRALFEMRHSVSGLDDASLDEHDLEFGGAYAVLPHLLIAWTLIPSRRDFHRGKLDKDNAFYCIRSLE